MLLNSALIYAVRLQNSPMFPSMEIFFPLREKLPLSCGLSGARCGLFGGVAMFEKIKFYPDERFVLFDCPRGHEVTNWREALL